MTPRKGKYENNIYYQFVLATGQCSKFDCWNYQRKKKRKEERGKKK